MENPSYLKIITVDCVDCESISFSPYTSQSSPKLLMKPICTNSVTIILVIEQPLLTTPSFPNKDNTSDHNPQQQPTPTRRDKFFDKFVVILLVPLLLPPFPYPPFLNVGNFYLVQLCVQLLDHHHNSG
jgi:hypothetical protein